MKELREWGITIVVVIVILVSVTIVVTPKATEAYERGYSEGYSQGYVVGAEGIGTDYRVRNPTYKEVQELLDQYKQDREPVSERPKCRELVADLNSYAESKGVRAALVIASIPDGRGFPLAAFETIDKGLIFLCPRTHQEVKVEIGKRYSELNDLSPPDWDDTITKTRIIW